MKVTITNAELEFLCGGEVLAARFPIKVIQAAKRRHDLLRAVPLFHQIPAWKSFRYEPNGPTAGSIAVTGNWRMDIRGEEANGPKDQVSITAVRKISDD
jgi:hypothetical protein